MAGCDRTCGNHVHFESYIIHEDGTGRAFGDASATSEAGVRVFEWNGTMLHREDSRRGRTVGARRLIEP